MVDQALTPKKRRTRVCILEAATKIFAAEGYRNTDVQVIADSARVGKGTIYRHFGSKEKLFLAVAKFNLDQLAESVTAEVTDFTSVVQVLRDVAVACARFYQQHPECVEIMIQERAEFRETVFPTHLIHRAENRAGLEELFQRGIESGELLPTDASTAVDAYSDMLYGMIVCGCLEGAGHELVPRARRATEFFLHGISADRSEGGSED
jgi:AcrR family transcriptional regulator